MNERVRSLLRVPYNRFLRDRLPRKIGAYNGVAIRYPRLFDIEDHVPDWKDGTVASVRETVRVGDRVVEIGSGFGVCTVWAARKATAEGAVTTFEASANRRGIVEETLELNGVADVVSVHHAVVGTDVDVFGELEGASERAPAELPDCDVLVTDCEGAELGILRELRGVDGFDPRSMVIETHGFAGSKTDEVVALLRDWGYEVEDVDMASPYGREEQDNMVVTAEQR